MSGRIAKRAVLAALPCVALLAACGGGGGGETGGATKGAKVIDVGSMDGAKGQVTFCTGKDAGGGRTALVTGFNKQFASQGLKVKMLEFPSSADEQRQQFTQRQRARSAECDVFGADVVWTAEFALQNWIYDMTPYVESRKGEFIPSTLQTAHYDGKYWGVPQYTNAGFLYYRSDQVPRLPATWQDVYADAAAKDGIAYQGQAYEGLTVDFLELAFAAGGRVLSDDGKKPAIDSPQNVEALRFMVDGVRSGAAPHAVTTWMEEEARRAFERGDVTYMRNWPYCYGLGNAKGSKVAGKFDVAPYPPFRAGGERAGILGGGNFVVSVYSKNPGAALKFVDYSTGAAAQKNGAMAFSDPPVLSATYDDPEVQKAMPFAPDLKAAVEQAKPRPVSPVYTQISQAIYTNVNAALSGSVTPEEALKKAQAEMDRALATF